MEILICIGIFLTIILFIEGGYFAFLTIQRLEQKNVKKRLRTLSSGISRNEEIDILRKRLLSQVSWFNRVLLRIPRIHKLDRFLEQANTRYPLGFYILLTFLLASCGYLIGSALTFSRVITLPLVVLFGSLPFLSVYLMKRRRMLKFERQLPDAIDLIARALKAGHAFTGGIKMVAKEFEDPVGTEFDKTIDEINFGVTVEDALKNLIKRINCPELNFFAVSVIIQMETGGNLVEVLDKISYLIRERFKLQGRIKILSAEGRISAIVLITIPFLICLYINMVNPRYLNPLLTDPVGKFLIVCSAVMMILGVIVIRKMISFRV